MVRTISVKKSAWKNHIYTLKFPSDVSAFLMTVALQEWEMRRMPSMAIGA